PSSPTLLPRSTGEKGARERRRKRKLSVVSCQTWAQALIPGPSHSEYRGEGSQNEAGPGGGSHRRKGEGVRGRRSEVRLGRRPSSPTLLPRSTGEKGARERRGDAERKVS